MDELDKANHRSRQELAAERDEIRRLSEERRRLKQQIGRRGFDYIAAADRLKKIERGE